MSCINKFTEVQNKINELDSAVMECEAKVRELQAKEMALVAREKALTSKSLTAKDIEELETIKLEQKELAEELRKAEAHKVEVEYMAMSLSKSLLTSFGASMENEAGNRISTEYSKELRVEFSKKASPKVAKLCRLLAEVGQAYEDIEALECEYKAHTGLINAFLADKCNSIGTYSSDFFNTSADLKAKYLEIVPAKTRNFISNLNAPIYRY
ncbi:hypothetical protein NSA50_13260 [Clostridium sp. DSM 100503]|uniref:hypothetical protein n=1 Tax=Clostridium sp. DSM 100503 TaxID=2963282 RepID=UPI00214A3A1E|nr:hypothetical protein [Clostridium sp. DSM 100503]MCR1952012.1 hypothetical protein [Clostridium sp. DSM 100503]